MKIKRAELEKQLKTMAEFLPPETLIQIEAGLIRGRNADICVESKTEISEDLGTVELKALQNVLSGFSGKTIALSAGETELEFRGKSKRAGLRRRAENIGAIESAPTKGNKVPEGFTNALRLAADCCDNSNVRFILTVVCCEPDRVEATNSYRIIRIPQKTGLKKQLLIPKQLANGLGKTGLEKVGFGKGLVSFFLPGGTRIIRAESEAEYPKLDPFLEFEGDELQVGPELRQALEITNRLQSGGCNGSKLDNRVRVTLSQGKVIVRGENENGWFEESVTAEHDAENFAFYIDAALLKRDSLWKDGSVFILSDRVFKIETEEFTYATSIISE